jgi:hypothetical protein
MRDERISFRARGVLALLMTHKIGFKVTLALLATTSPTEGVDALRTAANELETAGYLTRTTLQSRGGKFDGTTWELKDPFDAGSVLL